MEWIQRNPKKAVALSALAVLCVLILVFGVFGGGSDSPKESTLDGPTLATPTSTPSERLTVLPTPSALPTTAGGLVNGVTGKSVGSAFGSTVGGAAKSLPKHHIVVAAQSNGNMMGVGWWIPFADGKRTGSDTTRPRTFSHADTTYGDADLGRILAYGGPESKMTSCTITVDGKVVIHKEAKGPYAQVFCQG